MNHIDVHRVQGIVFDLYNTLIHITAKVDPYRRLLRALEFSYGQIEVRRRDLMTQATGDKTAMTEWLCPGKPVPDYDFDHDLLVELNSCRVYPDTREVLRQLQAKVPLFLLSNIATHYKAPFYRLGLEIYFSKVFFSSDLGSIKPEKEIYAEVVAQSGIPAENLLMVGDSPKADFFGAQAAGFQSILLDRKARWEHQPAVGDLHALADLFSA